MSISLFSRRIEEYLPGVTVSHSDSSIWITFRFPKSVLSNIRVQSDASNIYVGYAKDILYAFPSFGFEVAKADGIADMLILTLVPPVERKDHPINISQPSAISHPQLLNEDSSF